MGFKMSAPAKLNGKDIQNKKKRKRFGSFNASYQLLNLRNISFVGYNIKVVFVVIIFNVDDS